MELASECSITFDIWLALEAGGGVIAILSAREANIIDIIANAALNIHSDK